MIDRLVRLSSRTGLLVLLFVELLAPAGVAGQQPIVPVQLSFSDPGARSMGFGGAFVALADDATAAFSNPAGLVLLVEPEVSIEGRRWSYSTPFTESGRVEGLPSGFGIDTTVGLRTAISEDVASGLSFLSIAYPKGDWSIAFFRHQLAKFRFLGETQGLFAGGTDCCQIRLLDQRVRTDLDVVSYGLSGAFRVNERFDVGLGLVYHDASLTSMATLSFVDEDSLESLFVPNSYLSERSLLERSFTVEDSDWTVTVGFLVRLSNRWRIGGVYRQGPELEAVFELIAGEAIDFGVPPGGVLERSLAEAVDFPLAFGLGCAYQAPGGLTVSFQWDRVEYSSIVQSLRIEDQTVDDVEELHLGGEYVFLSSTPVVAVRVGVWLDPDHQLRAAATDDPVLRGLLPRGDDETHYAVGLGVAFPSFQLDFGIDVADRVDTASLSAIYNF